MAFIGTQVLHLNQDQNCRKFFYRLVMKARTKYYSNPNKNAKAPRLCCLKKMFSLTSSLWVASACWIAGDRLWFDWRLCNGSTLHKFYLTHVQLFNCAHLHMCAIVHRPLDRVYIICSSHNFLYNLDQRLRDCADSPSAQIINLCTNTKCKHQAQKPSTSTKHISTKHKHHIKVKVSGHCRAFLVLTSSQI